MAQRLLNKEPNQRDYRAINLRVQYYSKPLYRLRIPNTMYFPVPKVHITHCTAHTLRALYRMYLPLTVPHCTCHYCHTHHHQPAPTDSATTATPTTISLPLLILPLLPHTPPSACLY